MISETMPTTCTYKTEAFPAAIWKTGWRQKPAWRPAFRNPSRQIRFTTTRNRAQGRSMTAMSLEARNLATVGVKTPAAAPATRSTKRGRNPLGRQPIPTHWKPNAQEILSRIQHQASQAFASGASLSTRPTIPLPARSSSRISSNTAWESTRSSTTAQSFPDPISIVSLS
jgi:hypothetical protein